MANINNDATVSIDEVVATARQAISSADDARVAGLESLILLREAKLAMLDRERQRLSQIVPADDPRLLDVTARIAANGYLTVQARAESARSRVPISTPDPEAWILDGRIASSDQARLRGVAVILATPGGAAVPGLERVFVDEGGGFRIAVRARGRTTGRTGAAEDLQDGQPQVIVLLQESSGRVWRDTQLLTPAIAKVDYVEVDLDEVVPMQRSRPTRARAATTDQTSAAADPKERPAPGAGEQTPAPETAKKASVKRTARRAEPEKQQTADAEPEAPEGAGLRRRRTAASRPPPEDGAR